MQSRVTGAAGLWVAARLVFAVSCFLCVSRLWIFPRGADPVRRWGCHPVGVTNLWPWCVSGLGCPAGRGQLCPRLCPSQPWCHQEGSPWSPDRMSLLWPWNPGSAQPSVPQLGLGSCWGCGPVQRHLGCSQVTPLRGSPLLPTSPPHITAGPTLCSRTPRLSPVPRAAVPSPAPSMAPPSAGQGPQPCSHSCGT